MHHFCLDIGGTGTRGSLFDGRGEIMGRASGEAGALSLGVDSAAAAVQSVWAALCADMGARIPQRSEVNLCIGIAGKGLPGRAEELAARFDAFARVIIVGDGYGALLAATGGAPGAMIAIGTGVTAMQLDADGRLLALSGWGFPAGDLGSGAYMGLLLTMKVLKFLDGLDDPPGLHPQTVSNVLEIGGPGVHDLMRWHTGARPKHFAALMPIVLDGDRAGDAGCAEILDIGAAELARVCRRVHLAGQPVHVMGGLGRSMLPRLERLMPDIALSCADADAVKGLYLLSSGQAPEEVLARRPGFAALEGEPNGR